MGNGDNIGGLVLLMFGAGAEGQSSVSDTARGGLVPGLAGWRVTKEELWPA